MDNVQQESFKMSIAISVLVRSQKNFHFVTEEKAALSQCEQNKTIKSCT